MKTPTLRTAAGLAVPVVIAFLAVLLAGTAGCRQEAPQDKPEAVSLLGHPLHRAPATGEALAKLEDGLHEAALKLELDPGNPDNIILYGRALSGLWRYRDAIDAYTQGIAAHPDHAMLHRHRGHRFISVREFDKAVTDLARAAELNDHDFDIWYHLGLAHYLMGEFEPAEAAYRRCLEESRDDGSVIAVSNWLTLALMRQGKQAEADEVLEGIKEGMEAGENISYYKLLLFDKGLKQESELEAAAASSDLDMATIGYGLACRYLVREDKDKAVEMFRKIVALPYWPAFGFIAAEAELHRTGSSRRP